MIAKLAFRYFITWLLLCFIFIVPAGFIGYIEGDTNPFIASFLLYVIFGIIGLVGSFILAVGSVGAETAGNVLKDVHKYNASHRK